MAKLVIEVPEELRGLGEAFATMVARVQGTVAGARGGKAVDYGQVEGAIAEEAGDLERAAHRAMLAALDIDRSLYRQSGQRGGQPGGGVVDPVSLRAGVVGRGWLPRTARVMAHEVQQGTSRDAAATAEEYGRLPYPARLNRWRLALLTRRTAAADILEELVASGLDEGPGDDHPVHAAITYLQSNSEAATRMNYARARRLGLPLGSGNVEATCKSLFELRLKRCGARWKNASGQHIVQLRALALSDRWGPAAELILRPISSRQELFRHGSWCKGVVPLG